TYSRR
ncbi:relaxase/mobilization nuclease domain protein, partial [Vibrio parahaemolyticus VPTS-2010_2]